MAFASHGPVDLFYETFGDRADPALLLVNGFSSQCISYRAEWCERFAAAGFFVIRYDNRDVGLSSKLADAKPDVGELARALAAGQPATVPYTLSDMAGDGLAVLTALGIDRAHVLGVSMGGMIVQVMALEHPERLLSMTSGMSTTGDPDVGHSSEAARKLIMSPLPSDRDGYIARQLENARTWGSPACYDEARLSAFAGETFDRCFYPEGAARQMMAIMTATSRTAALANVRVPTLVLHGDADALVDVSGGRRTAEAIPGARFELLEGMGHDYPPDYWDRWVRLVADHARAATSAFSAGD